MHQLQNSGRIPLGDLVHDLDHIDDSEKVTPREVGDHLNLLFTLSSIGLNGTKYI